MNDTLTMRTARQRVREFKSESDERTARDVPSFDGRDCEAFLQLGIDAFRWLTTADAEMRVAVAEGRIAYDPAFDEAVRALARLWLAPCAFAEEWLARLQREGSIEVSNLATFRNCCEEMRAIVDFDEAPNTEVSPPLTTLRDQAITEFRGGQTAEFF